MSLCWLLCSLRSYGIYHTCWVAVKGRERLLNDDRLDVLVKAVELAHRAEELDVGPLTDVQQLLLHQANLS